MKMTTQEITSFPVYIDTILYYTLALGIISLGPGPPQTYNKKVGWGPGSEYNDSTRRPQKLNFNWLD